MRQILLHTALKILAGRKPACGFLPCLQQNYARKSAHISCEDRFLTSDREWYFIMSKKTIGVLTSGGDAPGMNAAVRAVTRTAIARGYSVFGIRRGYMGLVNGDMTELSARSVSGIIQRGGTVLYTGRCDDFRLDKVQDETAEKCRTLGMTGLVVIGGDGSFKGAGALSARGIPCIGIPGTIDNDIACTDYTIGYDTAMNTAVDMIDKLRDTAESHDKCSVVEVMGRDAGWLALNVGLAVGAVGICVPEVPYDINALADKIKRVRESRKQHFIVVFAEGCGNSREFAEKLTELTGIETRDTVLGHVQRGGAPTLRDRVIASEMGHYAVELLDSGKSGRVIGVKNDKVYDIDIAEALRMTKPFDKELYKIANEISF